MLSQRNASAVSDNDGTLWCEQPRRLPVRVPRWDRIKAIAAEGKHPEWKDKEPFASILKGDVKAALASGELRALLEIVAPASHSGMTDGGVQRDRQKTGSRPRSTRST